MYPVYKVVQLTPISWAVMCQDEMVCATSSKHWAARIADLLTNEDRS
jgi:hypothetical protein